jgi:Mg/Co/Ni transporter MgtE
MEKDIDTIPVATDQEEVANMFRQYDLASAPVVDQQGRIVGVITYDDVMDVIHEEAEEEESAIRASRFAPDRIAYRRGPATVKWISGRGRSSDVLGRRICRYRR